MKETKSERFNLHLTPTDKSIIEDNAARYNMNLTSYITAAAVAKEIYVLGDKESFDALTYQVKKIGTNINQIRMLAHLGKVEVINFDEFCSELEKTRKSLNKIIRKADRWQR